VARARGGRTSHYRKLPPRAGKRPVRSCAKDRLRDVEERLQEGLFLTAHNARPSGRLCAQMLSLRSLAFILASAIRRARALSCSALQCFPDIIIGRKIATKTDIKIATRTAAAMVQSPGNSLHVSRRDRARGARTVYEAGTSLAGRALRNLQPVDFDPVRRRLRQIMGNLHPQPRFGGAAESFREADGHFRADAGICC